MQMTKWLLLFTILIFTNSANAFVSPWQEASQQYDSAKLQVLISTYVDEKNAQKLLLGLHFKIKNGWKIYGEGSNSIGLPPSLDFTGSQNYKKHEILWPKAIAKEEEIGKQIFKYNVYENEVILPIEITLQDITKPTKLKFTVNYGLCKDVCIPASSKFETDIANEQDVKSLELIQPFIDKKIIAEADKISAQKTAIPSSKTLVLALIAAILGGAILNIMPCVLPVLGIKIMSIINHDNARISNIRLAFFATITGIISCFIIFAIFASVIAYTGNVFNWGLQFQNPYFLIFLITILIVFIANMIGLFEVNFSQFFANLLNKKISTKKNKSQIFIPNFLSGVLAVLLATPCSAPFLGSAISFSILQPTEIIFLLFLAMGLGFSAPYLILLTSPRLIYLLPKAGNWMNRVKELMAGLLAATLMWLLYVLSNNIGFVSAFVAAIVSILILASFKIRYKFLKILAFTALFAAIFSLPNSFEKSKNNTPNPMDRVWKKFDEAKLQSLVAEGKTVVVDVTADWCLTCKFNKINVLHDKDIMDRLKSDNVVAMRADITKPDPEVLSFINRKGRYAIPFNAVYGPNAKDGLLTNELLNKKELIALIKKASEKTN